jgi:recombination protein RecT
MNGTALTPIQKFKSVVNAESVQEQFKNALAEGAPLFVASLIDIYGNDSYLQKCDPKAVIMEALKAATLKLPINKSLGFAYIVPYKNEPQFQVGYKGYIQLAMRTGQYKYINADVVFEGELKGHNKLTGEIDISGEAKTDKVVGYFAYIETVNGFKKTVYWNKQKITEHAKRYSKSYVSNNSPWKSNFDEMALKTMLRHLLSKYGIMSVELMNAFSADTSDERTPEAQAQDEISQNANGEVIDVENLAAAAGEQPEEQPAQEGQGELFQAANTKGPDF